MRELSVKLEQDFCEKYHRSIGRWTKWKNASTAVQRPVLEVHALKAHQGIMLSKSLGNASIVVRPQVLVDPVQKAHTNTMKSMRALRNAFTVAQQPVLEVHVLKVRQGGTCWVGNLALL